MLRNSVLAGSGAVLLLLIAAAVSARRDPAGGRAYRVGFDIDKPYHYLREDGSMAGMVYDILTEAARRTGIVLEWRFRPESSEAAMRSGEIDFWPDMAVLPHRRRFLHFTSPWRRTEY